MIFNSIDFLIFLPIVLLVYYIIPKNVRQYWLLISSYYFYMCWNAKYALLIFASTLITFFSGIFIAKIKNSQFTLKKQIVLKKVVLAISFASNLSILIYFKYTNFIIDTICNMLGMFHIEVRVPQLDILLPVGISFYTFQALSYSMDVYRDEIYAEKNFFRYALFVSFFPQLVAGPIERSKNLLKQLAEPKAFDYIDFYEGLLLMLWGFFLKIVIADRISIFVDYVYGESQTYNGWYLSVATVLFAFQIYCDFYGYSCIAMGTAKMLRITLMENFNAPYLSISVNEFWRNWHISLTSWFRDYLYIPLGGGKKGKFRKSLNKLIVFFISGLWHGAHYNYVFWGVINGIYQLVEEWSQPIRDKFVKIFNINRFSIAHKSLQAMMTFFLVDFSWIFFRTNRLNEAFSIIKSIFTANNLGILFDGESLYYCGLDRANFSLVIVCLGLLLFADICKQKKICIRKVIMQQDAWFRCLFVACTIAFILLFGKYGPAFDKAAFIYFQF